MLREEYLYNNPDPHITQVFSDRKYLLCHLQYVMIVKAVEMQKKAEQPFSVFRNLIIDEHERSTHIVLKEYGYF